MSGDTLLRHGDAAWASAWGALWAQSDQYPLYQPKNQSYYDTYSDRIRYQEISFVVVVEGRPTAGVLGCVGHPQDGGSVTLSGRGLPLLYLEASAADSSWLRRARKRVKEEMLALFAQHPAAQIYYRDPLLNGDLGYMGRLLLESGGVSEPEYSHFIDLDVSEEALWKGLTKGCRWGINWGKRHLELRLLDAATITPEDMETFRLLHLAASGRATRTLASWEAQLEMIRAGEAFLVTGALEGAVVSASLFTHSSLGSVYGISATRRELFDKPISHVLLWNGLLEAKRRGCRTMDLGLHLFPNQGVNQTQPEKKELDISNFKRWFGTRTRTRMTIRALAASGGVGDE